MLILTPTDFSEIAGRAAEVAGALAAKHAGTVRLVHNMSPWISSSEAPVTAALDELAHDQLAAEADRLSTLGVRVERTVRRGRTDSEVAAMAAQAPVEMIVLGSGDPAAGHRLAGSVAERVAEGAPVPTLVVRQSDPLLNWLTKDAPLRVLCALDFSLSSDAALAALQRLTTLGGAVHIEAVHFARPGEARVAEDGTLLPGDMTALQRDVWQRIHDHLGPGSIKVHIRPDDGHAPEAMAKLAQDRQADLLVVGTRQIHGLRRLLTPSFSRGVLTHASANVLCVPIAAGTAERTALPPVQRILVAMAGTADDTRLLQHACRLLPSGGALHLIHVCPAPSPALNPVEAAEMYLDNGTHAEAVRQEAEKQLEASLTDPSIPARVSATVEAVIHADAATAIGDAAQRFGADLICMGSRGPTRLAAALLGSVAQAVIAKAHRPVLVVPPPHA